MRLHGTLERFCIELLRLGTDRLSFTRCLGTVLCRTVPLKAFRHKLFQMTASLSIHQEHEQFLKKISTIYLLFEALHKIFFENKFSSYRQGSSVEFPLASFLSVPEDDGAGSLQENFLVRHIYRISVALQDCIVDKTHGKSYLVMHF